MSFDFFFLASLGAGFLSFFSPCILPLIPSYVSFITGASLSELTQDSKNLELRRKIIVNSVLFILGFSAVFVGLGAGASFVGELLYNYQRWISRIGGFFMVFMGLHVMGVVNIPFLNRERKFYLTKNFAGSWVALLAGLVFAAGWTPCIGPILGSILFYASTTASLNKGIVLLTLYSAGLAVPFFLSSVGLGVFLQRYKKIRKHTKLILLASGSILIVMGILLITDIFPFLSFSFSSFTPAF